MCIHMRIEAHNLNVFSARQTEMRLVNEMQQVERSKKAKTIKRQSQPHRVYINSMKLKWDS